jgi:hypothetical protein
MLRADGSALKSSPGGTVIGQMFIEPDGVLRPAKQSGETPLALDQRQVAQVRTVMLDQVEGEQHRLMATVLAPQRAEAVSRRRVR